ncbi:MAG: glycosyltransferase [Cyanothece sp. SIO2G6]|nr:glycosyltransferase [Cyanothece sp. SIO2G6]
MRILLLHPNFPAQFRHLATALAQDPHHEVVFATARRDRQLPGVQKLIYPPIEALKQPPYPGLGTVTKAVATGERVYVMVDQLKRQGFVPDVVLGHSGWGPTLFLKDLFPKAELICYMEWFYRAHGSDFDFVPGQTRTYQKEATLRLKNVPFLVDLYSCDRALTPTHWQHQQFPPEFQPKITVRHDGIDTRFFCPNPKASRIWPNLKLDLTHAGEIVTYVARGMEPYRGFPQFMEAVSQLQQRRSQCHVIVVGSDRVAYGTPRTDGKTYRQAMLEQFEFDRDRLHFTGHLDYAAYLRVLQASTVHVYLTYPFVLSWSMLEAMATGCALVASRTPPVQEVIDHGINGLLVDFFDVAVLVDQIAFLLDHPTERQHLGQTARQTVVDHYDLATLLPQTIAWLADSAHSRSAHSRSAHSRSSVNWPQMGQISGDRPDQWELF